MGVPLQKISLKDLIEIIQSFSGKLSRAALAEKLSDITKEYLKKTDRKRFEKEKDKALNRMGEVKGKDVNDADWQLLSEKTISRLISGKTQGSKTAAMEAHPLMELMRDLCETYFEFDFDRMAGHTFRQLKQRGYDTGHWEDLLRNDASYQSDDFMFDLVRYAVASGQGNTAEQPNKPAAAAASAPARRESKPLPEDPGFDPRLLPDIVLRKQWKEIKYTSSSRDGSPLAQLLWEWEAERLFLLYGEGDSGVAGAGKTTALRHLPQEKEFRNAAYVPLWEVYNPFGMRRLKHEVGIPRVLEWLDRQGTPVEPNGRKLLLLDGLDEIAAGEGIRAFCDDLAELAGDDRFTLVLSSVIAPEQLPNWSELRNISFLLNRFVKCCMQPLTPKQRQACLGDMAADYPQALTTPHQVSLCRDVSLAAAEQKDLFFRWVSEKKPSGHSASLFYRSLAAQICSWFRADPVNDAQNERDSFVLMFALPAVAFRMAVNEIYDEHYAPEACPMDAGTVDRLLRLAFPVYAHTLHRYSFYQNSETALAILADSMRDVGAEGLLSEKTGAILCRSFHPVTMKYVYHFPNRAMRDGFAALHLANLFCFAHENLLPTGPEFDEFYTCPTRFLPHTMLESAAVLVDERLQAYGQMQWILEEGPFHANGEENPFCHYITRSLGAAFCTALRLETEGRWRTEAELAYHEFLCTKPRMAEGCAMDHTANLCVQSRMLREKRNYHAAAEKARTSVWFAQRMNLLNADGYQALAMLYLTQVKDGLNLYRAWEDYGTPIPQADIDRADGIFEELQRLAQLPEPRPLESEVFGTLSAESVSLIPDCLCLLEKAKLRLDAYKQAEFFGSGEVEFLLTASFVAKAHSVWAALCPAVSGAAINLLAGCFENDQERMENDPELPFFAAHPELHLSIEPEQLSYPEKDCRAARLYLRIIRLRRGLQPYSCRNLAQALLSRRFRLDEAGRPIPACDGKEKFTEVELEFLNEITRRACSRLQPTYSIPRIRYLNDRIDALSGQKEWEHTIAWYQEEAGALFRREWTQGECGEKLDSWTDTKADLLTVMLAELYRESYLPNADPAYWLAKIKDYHSRSEKTGKVYSIGGSFR